MNGTTCFVDRGGKIPVKESADVDQCKCVGTPAELMKLAERGHLPKMVLAEQLDIEHRHAYLDACAVIERKYTEECATNNPCLESGCAVEGEICLQPLLTAGIEYRRACAAEWIKLFVDPRNRIDVWKH